MNLLTAQLAAAWLAAGLLAAGGASSEPPAPGSTSPRAAEAPPPDDEPRAPSLDELLGIDGQAGGSAQTARENEAELQRRLAEESLGDVLDLALARMLVSADLLDVQFDPGLGTQRVQQDVLAKLDELIDIAKQMSGKQQMSSGGGSSRSGSPKPSPGQRPSAGGQRGQQRADRGSQDGQATEPPPGQTGDINTVIEETESEWGHLPPRFREMFEQGQNGVKSHLYRRLTEEYYKRLAEEGSS